ncbi:MAG: hypothetical protein ACRBI6_03845 [Acidimicrobiales bacterium]
MTSTTLGLRCKIVCDESRREDRPPSLALARGVGARRRLRQYGRSAVVDDGARDDHCPHEHIDGAHDDGCLQHDGADDDTASSRAGDDRDRR